MKGKSVHETWRWFGPGDKIPLDDVVQTGAKSIVTALHQVPAGTPWSYESILERKELIRAQTQHLDEPLKWTVAESLPVSEDIKLQSDNWRVHVENYLESLTNLAKADIQVVCYNFMPLLDWTRTSLAHRLQNRAACMRFDIVDFAMFDLFILRRKGADKDTPAKLIDQALKRHLETDDEYKNQLIQSVLCGLPGGQDALSLSELEDRLSAYAHLGKERLCQNQQDFLEMVAPHAQKLGLRLCCHPDDPPYSLLGLPRVMSTQDDYQRLVDGVDLPSNGITLCTGSLSARSDNDLPKFVRNLGHRVHFLHLRNVKRESEDVFGSFHESELLQGEVDMAQMILEVLKEEKRRRASGRQDFSIPFRPDHGHNLLCDDNYGAQPGYPAIGRLKSLAELRGLIVGIEKGATSNLESAG